MKNSERLLDFFAEMLPKDKTTIKTPLGRRHPEVPRDYEHVILYIDQVVLYGNLITCQVSARLDGPGYSQQSTYQSMSFHKDMWPPTVEQISLQMGIDRELIHPDRIVIAPIMDDKTPRMISI
jgi:hypothetical protein